MAVEHRTFLIGKFFLNSCHYNVISVFVTCLRMLGPQTDFKVRPEVVTALAYTPALGRLRPEEGGLKANLDSLARS